MIVSFYRTYMERHCINGSRDPVPLAFVTSVTRKAARLNAQGPRSSCDGVNRILEREVAILQQAMHGLRGADLEENSRVGWAVWAGEMVEGCIWGERLRL